MFKPGDKVRLIYQKDHRMIKSDRVKEYLQSGRINFRTIYIVNECFSGRYISLVGFGVGAFNARVFQLEED